MQPEGDGVALTDRLDSLPLGVFHVVLIVVVLAALAFDHMDQVVLSFVIPRYREEWGLSASTASLNPATGLAGTFVGAVVWGMVADRIGRKRTLLVTLTVFSVTMGINGFAWSFSQLLLTCIVMGSGVGGVIPLSFTLLAEFTPARHRGPVMVLVGILSLVGGYLIASSSAVLLMDRFGWRSLFLIGLAPLVLVPFIARFVPESPRFLLSHGRVEEARRIVERLEAGASFGQSPAPGDDGQVRLERHLGPAQGPGDESGEGTLSLRAIGRLVAPEHRGLTLMLWSYSFLFGFFTFGFLTWLPTVLTEVGFEEGRIDGYTTIMDVFAVPSAVLAAVLFFAWSTKHTLVLFPALAGGAMLVLSVLVGNAALRVGSLLTTGGAVFAFGTILLGMFGPYASEVYPTEVRGTGTGWATGMSRLGAITAIPIGGVLLSSGVPLFWHQLLFGVPLLVAAVIMAVGGRETRGRRLEEISAEVEGVPGPVSTSAVAVSGSPPR